MKKKNKIPKRNLKKEVVISEKIHEIISYLSFSFTSGVLERKDNEQFLYLKYIETIRKSPKAAKNDPGWFFLKFKWLLMTRYSKEVKRIMREHEIVGRADVDHIYHSKEKANIGYLKEADQCI